MSDHVTLREIVTNLLYPPRCLLCGTLCGWEELLCESCQKQQPQAGEFFWEPEVFGCRGILWCARYEGAFRAGMEQLKFEGVRESLPLREGVLARDGRATAHAAAGRAARITLAKESYRAGERKLPPGEHILLIDDIITTGATLENCAALLLAQGAESVTAAAVLRTPRPEGKKLEGNKG